MAMKPNTLIRGRLAPQKDSLMSDLLLCVKSSCAHCENALSTLLLAGEGDASVSDREGEQNREKC